MNYLKHTQSQRQSYERNLALIGTSSKLFSDSASPYLSYRITEKLYCESFNAIDCGRSDISIDAKLHDVGIGIKTFLHGKGNTFQKIAEFNKGSKRN